VRLQVPAIGVDSQLMPLGLEDDGSLEVPPSGFPAGWFTGGPMPGETGPAVMAGHVDWGGSPGVFYDLRSMKPGDAIEVTRADGSRVAFAVVSVEQFPKNEFPSDAVYGDLELPGLRLITCGGSFDRAAHSYEDNIVVFADLVPA
jgi:sortase (surface protein transpeptidase)